jgi:hypothetical protein
MAARPPTAWYLLRAVTIVLVGLVGAALVFGSGGGQLHYHASG